LRLVEQHVLGGDRELSLEVIAKAVGLRLEHGERLDVGLLLRRVHPARREGHGYLLAGVLRRLFHAGATGNTIRSASETFLPPADWRHSARR